MHSLAARTWIHEVHDCSTVLEQEEQLALLNAHPDLAGRAAISGEMTSASTEEQGQAGLDELTPSEMELFTTLNEQYRAKFGACLGSTHGTCSRRLLPHGGTVPPCTWVAKASPSSSL